MPIVEVARLSGLRQHAGQRHIGAAWPTCEGVDGATDAMDDLKDAIDVFARFAILPAARRLFLNPQSVRSGSAGPVQVRFGSGWIRFELIVEDDSHVYAIDVRSHLQVENVAVHLKRMERFRGAFGIYRDHVAIGAVSGITIDNDAVAFAHRKGLYVLGEERSTVLIRNRSGFRPKRW